MPWWGVMLIIIVVALAIMVALYIVGKKLQTKQQATKDMMRESAQPVTMMVIDKKMLPMKDAKLPKQVMDQTPKRYQKAKLPIVKAKIGPQIVNMICDDGIYDSMPVKGEVKAMVSGIYIVSIKNVRGKKAEEPTKKTMGEKLRAKQRKWQKVYDEETAKNNAKAEAKMKEQDEKRRAKKIMK